MKAGKSPVYFVDARLSKAVGGPYQKLGLLFEEAGVDKIIGAGDAVAIKLHMGELGNVRYIRPIYVQRLVELVKAAGGQPFVTDTTAIYRAKRNTIFDYLDTARRNGFTSETMGCPLIIADGFKNDGVEVTVENPLKLEKVKIAQAIYDADVLISLAHVTLHLLFPLGAAIKNLGMGGVTQESKKEMHAAKENGPAYIGTQKATIDGAKAIVKKFKGKFLCINMAMDVTPGCDCESRTDLPIVPDIGILAATDAAAIDKASFDLMQRSVGYPGSVVDGTEAVKVGGDKLKAVYERIDADAYWQAVQMSGIGSLEYELIHVK